MANLGVPKPAKVTPGVPPPTSHTNSATPAATATNVRCGQILTASIVLNGDLTCTTAVTVTLARPSITFNLNGHTISSGLQGSGLGVEVSGNSDIVENGVITGFTVGVFVRGSGDGAPPPVSAEVTKIRATYNGYGIIDASDKGRITANIAYGNTSVGIREDGGTVAAITNNVVSSNGLYGIWITDASGAAVSGNQADGNQVNGILTQDSHTTTITGNTANFNVDDGIVTSDRDTIDGGGDLAKGNDYATGATPEQCSGIACN